MKSWLHAAKVGCHDCGEHADRHGGRQLLNRGCFLQAVVRKGLSSLLPESEQRGLDDPVEEGPLLQGIEVAVRAFMAGAVAPGMFF